MPCVPTRTICKYIHPHVCTVVVELRTHAIGVPGRAPSVSLKRSSGRLSKFLRTEFRFPIAPKGGSSIRRSGARIGQPWWRPSWQTFVHDVAVYVIEKMGNLQVSIAH